MVKEADEICIIVYEMEYSQEQKDRCPRYVKKYLFKIIFIFSAITRVP